MNGRGKRNSGRHQRGFTFLELVVVVLIIAILFLVAIDKYLDLLVDVERATMEQNLGVVRSAVAMQVAKKIVEGEVAQIAGMAATNPMNYLSEQPKNYLGELEQADLAVIEGGHWYFDKAQRSLVYQVKHKDYFQTELNDPPRVRFRIELVYDDKNGNGSYEPGTDQTEGVRIAAQNRYSWLKQAK